MSINLSELIWTVINFLVLMVLLKIFLYGPLLKWLDAHRTRVAEGLAEGERAQQAREETAVQLANELQRSNGEARRILSEAKASDERVRSALLGKANEDAATIRSSVQERIAAEEQAALETVEESLPELASLLTLRLLGGIRKARAAEEPADEEESFHTVSAGVSASGTSKEGE